ncbi:MAG: DoxX family membrane protein [Planctomycetes bacterium]|nr:DoxX family membrane protein [Planctomycetota bacterium]
MRSAARILLAVLFVIAGANHLRDPAFYLAMMPTWVPAPEAMNLLVGVAEALGGIGMLNVRTRRAAGWGLLLLLLAVFPANIGMAQQPGREPWANIPTWVLWARLPLQGVLMVWVWWVAVSRSANPGSAPRP